MVKKLIFCLLFVNFISAMNNQLLQQVEAHPQLIQKDHESFEDYMSRLRVDAFRRWQEEHKDSFAGKKTDDPEIVDSYIYLTMFINDYDNHVNDASYIKQAVRLAKHICPAYEYWDQFFHTYPKIKQGKCHSHEEITQLVLEPMMQSIGKLKKKLSILKGEDVQEENIQIDWHQEAELLQSRMTKKDNWSVRSIIQQALPDKMAEFNNLSHEINTYNQPEHLALMLTKKNKELAHAREQVEQRNAALDSLREASVMQIRTLDNQVQELMDKFDKSNKAEQAKDAHINYVTENIKQVLKEWGSLAETPANNFLGIPLFDAQKEIAKRDELISRLTNLILE